MSRIVVAALVKDEAARYLRAALAAWSEFADTIVVLDDCSTDDTPAICKSFPKVRYTRRCAEHAAWGAEAAARAELWDLACEAGVEGDLIFVLDADMVPASDPREYAHIPVNVFYYTLYDLWGREASGRLLYRDDALWCAHRNPRAWAARHPGDDFDPEWNERGLHCGHFPLNLPTDGKALFLTRDAALLHFAYMTPEDREAKRKSYVKEAARLSHEELRHAQSITAPHPVLKPLYWKPKWVLTKEN